MNLSKSLYATLLIGLAACVASACRYAGKQIRTTDQSISMTLIPPSPVSDKITLDIRGGFKNETQTEKTIAVKFYLDSIHDANLLHAQTVKIAPDTVAEVKFPWPTAGHAGNRKIIMTAESDGTIATLEKEMTILPSDTRSTNRVDGAFLGFYHWSENEGKYWNADLKKTTDAQWREMMDAQNNLGMNIVVIQEVFRNATEYAHKHTIEQTGYKGVPYYPSGLYPGQVDLAAADPLEAVLSQADKNGMHVFVGIGMYAWFDFSRGSLEWHKKVADEIWAKYGHHPSFYGWYISEEQDGGLGNDEDRENIVVFFKEFKAHIRRYTPEKPVMLATNSHNVRGAEDTYRRLLTHLDILCPFGFHRMPPTDLTGEQSAALLQQLCDEAGAHFWLDMEAFEFAEQNALVPRPIDGLISDMNRFKNFEKIICYQFPGLFSSPEMSIKPGGEPTVKLYLDYKKYFDALNK